MRLGALVAVLAIAAVALAHTAEISYGGCAHPVLQRQHRSFPTKRSVLVATATPIQRLLAIRGGVVKGQLEKHNENDDGNDDDDNIDEDEPEEVEVNGVNEEEEEEGEEQDEDSDVDAHVSIADFSENAVMKRISLAFENTPPISRLYIGSCVAITAWAWMFNSNLWPRSLAFDWRAIVQNLQYWRLITPFLSLGPLSVNFLLNLNYLWTYLAQMERLHARKPADFVMLLSFGMLSLTLLHTVLSISYRHLGAALGVYLSYIFGRLYQGQDTLLLGMFAVKVEHVPFIFMLMSFLVEQELPVLDIAGIVLGHLYMVGHQAGLLNAPELLTSLMSHDAIKQQYDKFVSQLA